MEKTIKPDLRRLTGVALELDTSVKSLRDCSVKGLFPEIVKLGGNKSTSYIRTADYAKWRKEKGLDAAGEQE